MTKILVIHGPNLNLLGSREPEVYGSDTLASIDQALVKLAEQHSVSLETFQSNIEGEIVNRIHQASANQNHFVIINPAAFTHTSVAIRDAFLATDLPFIEVHLLNVFSRAACRTHSYLSDFAEGVICCCVKIR